MPIPELNQYGLLPPGEHECTLDEAHERFGQTAARHKLWENLDAVLCEMRAANLSGTVYINGSFVTDKPAPADVEITLDVRKEDIEKQGLAYMFYHRNHARLKHERCIDWYPTLPASNDFISFFQYIGRKTALAKGLSQRATKGILKVTVWNTTQG